jgi:hypothetical protein
MNIIAACHRQTQVFDLAVRRMISFVPSPSAVSKTISARDAVREVKSRGPVLWKAARSGLGG